MISARALDIILIDLHAPSYFSPVTAGIGLVWVGQGNPQRDSHLRSPGFFDVDSHSRMTSGRPASAQEAPLHAREEPAVAGVTKNVPLALKVNGFGPCVGGTRAGFTATGDLNWQDFGVTWNAVVEAGRVAVGDKVTSRVQIEAVSRHKPRPPAGPRSRTDRRPGSHDDNHNR